MNVLNKTLVNFGITHLIDNRKEEFIKKLSLYLYEKPELINYFFNELLPINDKIRNKIELVIMNKLLDKTNFINIEEIEIGFDKDSQQIYKVKYKYLENNNDYIEHQVHIIRIIETEITPNDLNLV